MPAHSPRADRPTRSRTQPAWRPARAQLRGDLLIVGADDQGNDTDVPYTVIEAARRSGLLPRCGGHD